MPCAILSIAEPGVQGALGHCEHKCRKAESLQNCTTARETTILRMTDSSVVLIY